MIVDEETLLHVKYIFEHILKRQMIERNAKQAEVPDNCIVLKNEVGTAPGMLFNQNGKMFFSLPGVPNEMKWLMENKVIPFIKTKYPNNFIEHRTLLTAGVGESFIAEKLKDFEQDLNPNIKLAYLPNYGMVRLRLTSTGNNFEEVNATINNHFLQLQNILQDIIITNKDETIVEVVSNLLVQNNETISTAESCTGGFIAHQFTSLSGSSKYFKGSVVAYSNDIKENVLQVLNETLVEHGAVSEAVVKEMAKSILQKFNTNYSIAVSGIMGPNGGTNEKPVGTVWIAVASRYKVKTKLLQLKFDRKKNIELTSMNSFLLIRELIVDKH
jgi:nicotinamide-nucleotide amidase